MFYAAYIAVCLTSTPMVYCDKANALHWVVVPQQQDSHPDCVLAGIEYIKWMDLTIPGMTYPKIYCIEMDEPK